jgi:Flp pilus assembly protein CpaB
MSLDQSSGVNRRALAIVVALLVAVASVVGLFFLVQSQNKSNSTSNYVGVWVTKDQLAAGATIGANDVQVVQRDPAILPSNYLAAGASPVGQNLVVAAAPGTILTQSLVGSSSSPSLIIPDGWVAVAIPTAPSMGVAGYLQNGDHIDIIADASQFANGSGPAIRYVLQDVTVLKASPSGNSSSSAPNLMVVAVPRAQAEEVTYLDALYAQVQKTNPGYTPFIYALRNANQSSKVNPHTGAAQPPIYLDSGSVNPNQTGAAQLVLSVSGQASNTTTALSNATNKQNQVVSALEKAGLASSSVQATPVQVDPYSVLSQNTGTVTVNATVVVNVPDSATLATALDTARSLGASIAMSPGTVSDQPISQSLMNCLFSSNAGSTPTC